MSRLRLTVVTLIALAVLAFVARQFLHDSDAQHVRHSDSKGSDLNGGDRSSEIDIQVESDLAQSASASNGYFDSERDAGGDSDYARRYRRHHKIQEYLASPYRDEAAYQELLRELYNNGYGLEHWSQAGSAIIRAQLRLPVHPMALRQQGYTDAMMAEEVKNQRAKWSDDLKQENVERMVRYTGITDETLIDRLLSIPLFFDNGSNPFGRGMAVSPVDGEKFLSDNDWMPEELIDIVAKRTQPEIPLPDENARLYNFQLWKAGLLTPENQIVTSRIVTNEGVTIVTTPPELVMPVGRSEE